MRPDFVDHAHEDSRLRSAPAPAAAVVSFEERLARAGFEERGDGLWHRVNSAELEALEATEPRLLVKLDRWAGFAIAFIAAVYVTAHILVSAGICPQ